MEDEEVDFDDQQIDLSADSPLREAPPEPVK